MSINSTIFGQLISFIIFVFLCMKYIWPSFIDLIEKRRKSIADSFSSIEIAKNNLKQSKLEIDNLILNAKSKADIIIDEANKYKISILNSVRSESEIEKNKIINEAYVKIDLKRKLVEEELRKEIINFIILATEKITICSIDINKNIDIVNKIISKL
ncbi:MAG: ATP synthase Fo complex subunit b [Candidatus Westeberhardia cardiocondylae]|nr:ATP synthase Fo complex subunit b [Candidatus Westeberhardia cardiocondylae]